MTYFKLEIDRITKTYRQGTGGLPVLEDFSLQVKDLEFLVLLGPSGCGKSTLLRIINGIESSDSGRILIDGQDVTGTTGHGRGMVFQSFELFPWRTVLDNVAFGLEIAGLEKQQRLAQARECINLVGLAAFENSYPHQLSGGQRQRLGIARALYKEAELLILDEATSALDNETEDSFIEIIDNLDKNITVLIVAHRLSSIKNCKHFIRL